MPQGGATCTATQFDSSPLAYLQSINHNPLDLGDNLPTPANPADYRRNSRQYLSDLVGLSDLARDALTELERPDGRSTTMSTLTSVAGGASASPTASRPRLTSTVPGRGRSPTCLPPMAQVRSLPAGDDVLAHPAQPAALLRRAGRPTSAFMGGATVGQAALWYR